VFRQRQPSCRERRRLIGEPLVEEFGAEDAIDAEITKIVP
jgi:hypothetical protein